MNGNEIYALRKKDGKYREMINGVIIIDSIFNDIAHAAKYGDRIVKLKFIETEVFEEGQTNEGDINI